MTKMYTIKWEIDVEAKSPREAAEWAWKVMKEKENEATFLDVYNTDKDFINSFDMDYSKGV